MKITTTYQQLEAVKNYFLPYMLLMKSTHLRNIAHYDMYSSYHLSAVALNLLIDELMALIDKKLLSASEKTSFSIKPSDAQAIALYRCLISLPIPDTQIYLQNIRNNWIAQLDAHFIETKVFLPAPTKEIKPIDEQVVVWDYEDID